MYGPFTNERLVGRAIAGRRDEVVAGHQVRQRAPAEDGSRVGVNGRPEYVRQAVRRLARAARRRPHRPLLPAPGRPRRARRGDLGRAGRARRRRARSATSASPRRPPRRSGARTPCTRSPRCRPSGRCGPATSRTTACWPRCASSASGSSPTPRSGAASCPARSAASTTWRRRLPPGQPAVPGRQLRQEPRAGRPGHASSPPRRASPPASWRSPGCSPRATTSCRSRAPSGSPTWRRTSAPPTSS